MIYFRFDMSYLLDTLETKEAIDKAITKTTDVVLVLRFGRNEDSTCLQLDHLVSPLNALIKCSLR